jgi:hypothetical protein
MSRTIARRIVTTVVVIVAVGVGAHFLIRAIVAMHS